MKCAKDIMTTDVVCLGAEDSIIDAAKFFAEMNIHGVAVIDEGRLVGILTVTDILKFIDLRLKDPLNLPATNISNVLINLVSAVVQDKKFKVQLSRMNGMRVRDFMTRNPITVEKSTSIVRIAEIMNDHSLHRLPVVDRGKIVGMVTASDLMDSLVPERQGEMEEKAKSEEPSQSDYMS
ncbi:hypothetical protein A3K63_02340 [Candidatus Micrarchaeota archaeon RBG_16_49_10]|nr:MAG: hypothetical protein A3K63_02340 [Candidatus Micrarchaeota archaeon RBG_16_49_10]